MIPRTITFDEIRKGDRIRHEWIDNGVEHTATGTAQNLAGGEIFREWRNAGRCAIVSSTALGTITLLDRSTTPLPQEQGAPIMVFRYRTDLGYEYDTERVVIREGVRFRDMSGQRIEDDQILAWAPLTPGERVTR